MRTFIKSCTLAGCSLFTLGMLMNGGCSPVARVASTAPTQGYENIQSVNPTLNLSDYFDSDGRLKPGAQFQPHALRSAAPSGALPALDEEVWVIVKHHEVPREPATIGPVGSPRHAVEEFARIGMNPFGADDYVPTCGTLMCRMPPVTGDRTPRNIPLPLDHTEVRATVNAYIASVDVTQQFTNPYSSKIEAVYAFPLPENAAVNGFVMTIGERRIRGIIREREEAQQIYDAAKSQGYVASLLTQERPNIFLQHVANIEPGRRIDISITYFNTLAYDDGWYEFVFPMVVGPRFNPPTTTDGVGAVARNDRGAWGGSGQSTEIQYLAPNERSGHDIGLSVDLIPGCSVEEVVCRSHDVAIENDFSEHVRITLKPRDSLPNKDFVLRYRVAGDTVKTALLVNRQSSGDGYFTFMLIPPRQAEISSLHRRPLEMIFVLDCSGSMKGEPLKQVKDAVDHALRQLQPNDTFQIVQFSDSASQLGNYPLPATAANIRVGREYVRNLNSDGGTMMLSGINAALGFPHDPSRARIVTFLTDGFIGNESEVLAAIHDRLGPTGGRIFSFGVGSSPNRFLMDAMARMGGGAVAYLSLQDNGDKVMDAYFSRISRPVLSDIEIDWGGMAVSDLLPARLPDLHAGRPVIITGRFTGEPPAVIRMQARSGDNLVQAECPVDLAASQAAPALASVWARMHIASLMDRATWDARNADELPQQIRSLALQYGLASAYTSFIAVDSLTQTAGDFGTTVDVAVPVPEGVKYGTTVRER